MVVKVRENFQNKNYILGAEGNVRFYAKLGERQQKNFYKTLLANFLANTSKHSW